MKDETIASAHDQFEEDEARIRAKIGRTKRIQAIIWYSSVVLAALFFAGIALAHHQYQMSLEDIVNQALPILMVLTIAITTAYIVFIFLYFSIARRIYHSLSVIHPRLNAQLHPDDHRKFSWTSYFRRDHTREERKLDAAVIVSIKVFKLAALFALIVFMQFAWMEMFDISGQEMSDAHYAYLGLVDLTLFSVLVLFIIVLITIRIGKLGQQKDPHGTTGKGNYYEPEKD